MRKVFGVKVDEFAEAAIFALAWTAGLTSAYVAYYGREQAFLAAAIFLFISSVGMYYFLKLEAHQKAKRNGNQQGGESSPDSPVEQPDQALTENRQTDSDSKETSLTNPVNS